MNLKEKIKALPSLPGVYLMKDSLDNIIYVGKSKNLKNRVSSYFQSSASHSPKVVKLVKNIKSFDYILTDTEFEAFILECRLIKEIKPTYNRMLKNPLSYIYIKINGDYSKIETSKEAPKEDGSFYFGPFTSKNTVEKGLQGIKECLKIQCSYNFQSHSPCLNYSLGKCIGMCFDDSAKVKYRLIIEDLFKLFNGSDNKILIMMESFMNDAAERLDFDSAIKFRDSIAALSSLLKKEKTISFSKENKNILLIEYTDKDTFMFFLIHGPKIIFSKKFETSATDIESLKITLRDISLNCFSRKELNTPIKIGRNAVDESQIIYSYLKGNKNNCKYVIIPEGWIIKNSIIKIGEAIDSLF